VVSQQELQKMFEYDPSTGNLFWKEKLNRNTIIGSKAGTLHPEGYILITIRRKKFLAHRLVYMLHYGNVPGMLDHINRKRNDNRIENLRPASASENQYNKPMPPNSVSGHKGVTWCKISRRWRARIRVQRKELFLGSFKYT
jgi:hypothetical protein